MNKIKFTVALFFIFCTLNCAGQIIPANFNLIPNPGFEFNYLLPYNDTDFINNQICWTRANGTNTGIFPPFGPDIYPRSGKVTAILARREAQFKPSTSSWLDTTAEIIRTYPQCKLLKPLIAGVQYHFTMYIGAKKDTASPGSSPPYHSDVVANIGAYFSTIQVKDYSNLGRLNLKPQINFTHWTIPIDDTFIYTKLSGSFTATGGEQYLTIGNFDKLEDCNFAFITKYSLLHDFTTGYQNYVFYDDLSLVSDTTLPIITLNRFSLGNDTTLACLGDSITLGGEDHFFHYWWNTGDTSRFITIKTPGTYWCRVDFGCNTYTDTIVVKPLDFSFSLGKDTNINCTGSTMRLSAPIGYTYVWSTGATTAYADITSPGKYWCRLDYGCGTYTDTIVVNPNTFTFSLGADTTIKCFADSIRIFASAVYTNLWSTGETGNSILVTTPGTYWCRADDGCTTFTDTITINPIFESFSLGADTMICADIPLLLNAPNGKTILWNTGASTNTIEITTPGTYWCRIDFGCNTVTDTIVVSGSVAPAPFNISDTALCEASLPISISAPYTAAAYLWSNGSTDFTTNFNSTGRQWLRISNICGDKHFTDTFEIKSLNVTLSNINLGKDTSNCLYGFYLDTITLQVPANAAIQIKWSTGSTNSSIKVNQQGAYWVQVSNVCYSVSDTINITGCTAREVPKVDIPNAFSPNGDGRNDVFRLKYLPQQVVGFHLKIYNRYGQMVSELKSRNDEWDGGNYELGVYYYLFVYKDITGKEYTQKGDISLVR